jgi:DNA replication protein DnaC
MNDFMENLMAKRKAREIEQYGHELSDAERDALEAIKLSQSEIEAEEKKDLAFRKWRSEQLSCIPPRFTGKTFDNYRATSQIQRDAVAHLKTGRSAIIYGGNGLGKTHLAFAAIRYQVEHEVSSKYVLAFDFFTAIKRSFRDDTTDAVMTKYAQAGYLVVDEVDKTFGSQTEFVYLYSLVNERYNRMLPTVLITNADEADLVTVIGASTLSRVAGDGAIIELSGEDFRQRARA